MLVLMLIAMAATVACKPSFIAVPADQIAFLDLRHLHARRPRQALTPPPPQPALPYDGYQPITIHQLQQQQTIDLSPPPEPIDPARLGQARLSPIRVYPSNLAPIQIDSTGLAPARLEQAPVQEQEDNSGAASHFRPPDFREYVDFGAHTGDNGAFGWYADYPINNHDTSF